ncbi:hypothetical protein HMPREF9071_0923 [Capnocytophaga sp. oral taxon 338 str. F0234]|nr:hypothetical protein HMPREF9071_0923 [Capnocytophaga sp. oral taxon 338 str. F0234]
MFIFHYLFGFIQQKKHFFSKEKDFFVSFLFCLINCIYLINTYKIAVTN